MVTLLFEIQIFPNLHLSVIKYCLAKFHVISCVSIYGFFAVLHFINKNYILHIFTVQCDLSTHWPQIERKISSSWSVIIKKMYYFASRISNEMKRNNKTTRQTEKRLFLQSHFSVWFNYLCLKWAGKKKSAHHLT